MDIVIDNYKKILKKLKEDCDTIQTKSTQREKNQFLDNCYNLLYYIMMRIRSNINYIEYINSLNQFYNSNFNMEIKLRGLKHIIINLLNDLKTIKTINLNNFGARGPIPCEGKRWKGIYE